MAHHHHHKVWTIFLGRRRWQSICWPLFLLGAVGLKLRRWKIESQGWSIFFIFKASPSKRFLPLHWMSDCIFRLCLCGILCVCVCEWSSQKSHNWHFQRLVEQLIVQSNWLYIFQLNFYILIFIFIYTIHSSILAISIISSNNNNNNKNKNNVDDAAFIVAMRVCVCV